MSGPASPDTTGLRHDGHGPLRCHAGCPAYAAFMAEMHDQMRHDPTPEPDATVSDPAPLTDTEREEVAWLMVNGRYHDLPKAARERSVPVVEWIERYAAARVAEAVEQADPCPHRGEEHVRLSTAEKYRAQVEQERAKHMAVDAILAETPHQPQSLMQATFRLNRIRRALRPDGDMYAHGAIHGPPSARDLDSAREQGRDEERAARLALEAKIEALADDFDTAVGFRGAATSLRALLSADDTEATS